MAKSKSEAIQLKSESSYPEIEGIKGDIESLKSNVFELTKHIKEEGKIHSAEIKSSVAEQLVNAKLYGHKKYDDLEGKVKKHPAQSVAAAFAAGYLINMLMKRR
jgi:ElaB/YqjD/DUF883 family membrane-anchored ribosome-binding protein|tara:strand:- start:40035 stop:40346 length:312 start_codon:yes stop_codon:yes gene_type:complete